MSAERNKLPRRFSLKNRLDIDRLFAEGQRLPGNSFTLIWRPADEFRYAVLVPKAYGKAFQRVRLKRLYREAIRLARPALRRPIWVALMPRRGSAEPAARDLEANVRRLFHKLSHASS